MTQAKRQLPSERLRPLYVEPDLHRQVSVLAAMEGKQLTDIATEAVKKLLATKQTPVAYAPAPSAPAENTK